MKKWLLHKLGVGLKPKPYAAMAVFDDQEQILAAGQAALESGYTKLDALTPYPVHGIEEALGMKRSILGYICIVAAVIGVFTALGLQYYVGVVNYPLVVGGKPLFAFEPSIPVTFELMVLFSSFAAVLGMLGLNNLPSFFHPAFNYPHTHRATDDKFILVIEARDPKFDPIETPRLLNALGGRDAIIVGDQDKEDE